jgi:hypothetical protein
MVALRKRHLPHKVDIALLTGEGAEGEVFSEPAIDRPAYVEGKTKLVVDRRPSSGTFNQQITTRTLVVLLPDEDVAPAARITFWKGTKRERTATVVDAAYFEYPRTPGHWELYIE